MDGYSHTRNIFTQVIIRRNAIKETNLTEPSGNHQNSYSSYDSTFKDCRAEIPIVVKFTALSTSEPVHVVVDPRSRWCRNIRALFVKRGQINLGGQRINVAAQSATELLQCCGVCVVHVTLSNDEVHRSPNRQILL